MGIYRSKFEIKTQYGFTLVEVLIAILILSFITLYAYKMIDDGTDTKDKVTSEDRNMMQTLTAMNRIESDFNEIYSPLYSYSKLTAQTAGSDPYQDSSATFNGTFEGKNKNGIPIPQVVSDEKSSIVFLSTANRRKVAGTKESNFVWIKYSLQPTQDEDDKKNGGFDLVRQSISTDPFNSKISWPDIHPQVILSNVKSLEFNFYDERNKKYVTSLSELNENKNNLRSIMVKLVWINHDNNEFNIEKTFRILNPYFNTKQDDLNVGGTWGDGPPPPGIPTPPNGGQAEKHF